MAIAPRALDFTNVKDQGSHNPKRIPAGDYRGRVTKVEEGTSKQGNEQWTFTIVPTAPGTGGGTYPYYCGFAEDQMWKIRNLLLAAGFNIPKKRVKVDPQKLIGKEIGMTMDDDEYNDREKSRIAGVFPAEDLAADTPDGATDEPEEEEPEEKPTTRRTATARKATSSRAKAKPAPADDDDDADGDDEEMDIEEI